MQNKLKKELSRPWFPTMLGRPYQISYFRIFIWSQTSKKEKELCLFFWTAKIRLVFTPQNLLFIFWIVQCVFRHCHFWFAFIPVPIHRITTAQNKRYQQKNLAKKKETGGWYPVVCKIFVFIVNIFWLHTVVFTFAKIRLSIQKKLFVPTISEKHFFFFIKYCHATEPL